MPNLRHIKDRFKKSEYFLHETKRSVLIRFSFALLLVVLYFVFVSFKYGLKDGFFVTLLTWSVFVFCTPIADAGSLVDFPVRLITNIRMIYSESFVWLSAFLINLYALLFRPGIYDKTILLRLFKHILFHPFPFWSIIVISALGTFLSVYFGDELIDVAKHSEREKFKKHKSKYYIILSLFLFVVVLLFYDMLLRELGLRI